MRSFRASNANNDTEKMSPRHNSKISCMHKFTEMSPKNLTYLLMCGSFFQSDRRYLRPDTQPAFETKEAEPTVHVQLFAILFIQTGPLGVHVLYRAPLKAKKFYPELHS